MDASTEPFWSPSWLQRLSFMRDERWFSRLKRANCCAVHAVSHRRWVGTGEWDVMGDLCRQLLIPPSRQKLHNTMPFFGD